MIRIQDMILLQRKMEQIENWFNNTMPDLFFIKNKQLILTSGVAKPIKLTGLAQNKYLQFEPIVTSKDDNSVSPGIRITLGDPNVFIDIDVDTYYGMWYNIKTADLFGYAQNMINYLGRPEFGHNLFIAESYGASQTYKNNDAKITGGVKRDIKAKKKSFFDQNDYY